MAQYTEIFTSNTNIAYITELLCIFLDDDKLLTTENVVPIKLFILILLLSTSARRRDDALAVVVHQQSDLWPLAQIAFWIVAGKIHLSKPLQVQDLEGC